MNPETDDLVPPEQRRRNRITGLLLGALVLIVVVSFMYAFTRKGLPKDPAVWKRLERERSADEAVVDDSKPIGVATQPSSVTPAAATPTAQEPQR